LYEVFYFSKNLFGT